MSSVFSIDCEPAEGGGAGPSVYVGSHENRLVRVVADALAEVPIRYNPLLLCGPTGVGKTMLAVGLGRRWDRDHPQAPAWVLKGSDFARGLAHACETEEVGEFRSKTRQCGLLVVDNLHELARKTAAQHELAAALDERIAAGRPTLVTSGAVPADLGSMDHALLSRLSGGLVVRMHPPGPEARSQLVTRIVAHYELEPRIAEFLAGALRLPPSMPTVPELHRVCRKVVHFSGVESIDPSVVERCLENSPAEVPTLRSITALVAKRFHVTVTDLRGPSRRQYLVRARSLAMYLSRHLTETSLEQIGRYFGNRDHTTVMHACRKIEHSLHDDIEVRQLVEELDGSPAPHGIAPDSQIGHRAPST